MPNIRSTLRVRPPVVQEGFLLSKASPQTMHWLLFISFHTRMGQIVSPHADSLHLNCTFCHFTSVNRGPWHMWLCAFIVKCSYESTVIFFYCTSLRRWLYVNALFVFVYLAVCGSERRGFVEFLRMFAQTCNFTHKIIPSINYACIFLRSIFSSLNIDLM